MIRFIAKIKRQLFQEKGLSRYLLYAIGEIILVVIGILIALQVNNWNERRKLLQIDKDLRVELSQEFSNNLAILSTQIERGKNMVEASKKMLSLTGPKIAPIDDLDFEQIFFSVASGSPHFTPKMTIFNEMLLSGNFKAISNAELRRSLSDWETILKQLAATESLCESYRSNIKTIYIQNGNLVNEWIIRQALDTLGIDPGPYQFDTDNKNMLLNPEFENNIGFRYGNLKDLISGYRDVKILMEHIIELCTNT